MTRKITTPLDVPAFSGADPSGNPGAGFLRTWFRSDLGQLKTRTSGGTVGTIGAADPFAASIGDVELYFRKRALALCGFASMRPYWRDFIEGENAASDATDGGSPVVSFTRSTLLVESGGTANSTGGRILNFSPNLLDQLVAGPAGVWYFGSRFRVTTAVDAQTNLRIMLRAGSGTMNFGVVGSVSTAKFVATFDNGAPLVSSRNIDLGWHVVELARAGGVTALSVDEETFVAGDSYPGFAGPMAVYAQNGTTALNRGLEADCVFAAKERVSS